MDPTPRAKPAFWPRAAAYGLALVSLALAVLFAAEVPRSLADPATYSAAFHMSSDEAVYRSVEHYAFMSGVRALGFAALAALAAAHARTGRWGRTVLVSALALAALTAWRYVQWAGTGFDH